MLIRTVILWMIIQFIIHYVALSIGMDAMGVCDTAMYPNCYSKGFEIVPKFYYTTRQKKNPQLFLYYNTIKKIHTGAFMSAGTNIKYLDIGSNKLSEIEEGGFQGVNDTLQVLMLDRNQLTVIKPHYFIELKKLRKLNLSKNKLSNLDGAFVGLEFIVRLMLEDNMLESLPDHLILNRTGCRECTSTSLSTFLNISLERNELRYVPVCALETLQSANPQTNISITSLIGNSFLCDCPDGKWAKKYLEDYNRITADNIQQDKLEQICIASPQGLNEPPIKFSEIREQSQCDDKAVRQAKISCSGVWMNIKPEPHVTTPTISFNVSESVRDLIDHYAVTLIALDGTGMQQVDIDSNESSYTVTRYLRRGSEQIVCVQPKPADSEGVANPTIFNRVCKSYVIPLTTGSEEPAQLSSVSYSWVYAVMAGMLIGGIAIFAIWRYRRYEQRASADWEEQDERRRSRLSRVERLSACASRTSRLTRARSKASAIRTKSQMLVRNASNTSKLSTTKINRVPSETRGKSITGGKLLDERPKPDTRRKSRVESSEEDIVSTDLTPNTDMVPMVDIPSSEFEEESQEMGGERSRRDVVSEGQTMIDQMFQSEAGSILTAELAPSEMEAEDRMMIERMLHRQSEAGSILTTKSSQKVTEAASRPVKEPTSETVANSQDIRNQSLSGQGITDNGLRGTAAARGPETSDGVVRTETERARGRKPITFFDLVKALMKH